MHETCDDHINVLEHVWQGKLTIAQKNVWAFYTYRAGWWETELMPHSLKTYFTFFYILKIEKKGRMKNQKRNNGKKDHLYIFTSARLSSFVGLNCQFYRNTQSNHKSLFAKHTCL